MELTDRSTSRMCGSETEIPALRKRCTPRQLVMWAAASRDFYEIHYDVEYARSIGLSGLVVHGALKHAFLGQLLHDWIAPLGSIVEYRVLLPWSRSRGTRTDVSRRRGGDVRT